MDQYIIRILLGSLAFIIFLRCRSSGRNLDHIPTVGYSSPVLSYISAIRYFWAGRAIMEEGYRKYPNRVWKFPTLHQWIVVANGTRNATEIGRAPDEQLAPGVNFATFMQLKYTLGPEIIINPYHVKVVRTEMTRNITDLFDDLREEMVLAFEDTIPSARGPKHAEWVTVPVFHSVVEIMGKILARVFVGRPLCEFHIHSIFYSTSNYKSHELTTSDNKEFRRICVQSGKHIIKGRMLRHFPKFLRPTVAKLFIGIHGEVESMKKLLQPLLDHRLEQERLHGSSWPGKPNDFLAWMIEEVGRSGKEVTSQDIAVRIYLVSFASFLISTMLMCALYEIAKRPEYVNPLREEVENLVAQERWSKDTISKMYKLDSFLREVLRFYDAELIHLGRAVLQDFTFSDGTLIPAGSTLYANSWGTHHSTDIYSSPNDFLGFRFLNKEDCLKQPSMAKATLDYNPFGYGKHACPGRFFAATQLKTILAYVITTYDIKNEIEGVHPAAGVWVESSRLPNKSAKILFKKRC